MMSTRFWWHWHYPRTLLRVAIEYINMFSSSLPLNNGDFYTIINDTVAHHNHCHQQSPCCPLSSTSSPTKIIQARQGTVYYCTCTSPKWNKCAKKCPGIPQAKIFYESSALTMCSSRLIFSFAWPLKFLFML